MAAATVNGNETKKSGGFFGSLANPVIRKMEKNAVYDAEGKVATYGGVASKTVFFLIVTLIGFIGFIVLHNIMLNSGAKLFYAVSEDENAIYDLTISGLEIAVIAVAALVSIITPFLAWLIRPTIPVTGTIYALAQGVVIGFITIALREDLRWIRDTCLCHFTYAFSREFFDYESGRPDLDKLLQEGEAFGGYDCILLWHEYPRLGLDSRTQWDFYDDYRDWVPSSARLLIL